MATFMTTLLATLGATGATAGTAAAGTAAAVAAGETVVLASTGATLFTTGAAAGAAAAGGMSLLEATLIGSTLISGGLAVAGGLQQQAMLDSQAKFERFNAGQDEVDGIEAGNKITADLINTIGSQRAGLAANGFDLSNPTNIERAAQSEADRQLSLVRGNTTITAASRRAKASALRGDGRAAALGGFADGAASIGNAALRARARG